MSDYLRLCELCQRQIAGEVAENIGSVDEPHQCVLCFGLLDTKFKEEVCFHAIFQPDSGSIRCWSAT